MYKCENCDEEFECQSDLVEIRDMGERLSAGEFVPAGECPECGSLCHDSEAIMENIKRLFGMKSVDWHEFRNHKAELVRVESGEDYNQNTIKAVQGVLAILDELQEQAVTYGYSHEEVFG